MDDELCGKNEKIRKSIIIILNRLEEEELKRIYNFVMRIYLKTNE